MSIIYHLITQTAWETAKSTVAHRPESLEAEGFIHCSQNEEQLLRVANRLYPGRTDMLVLDVDTDDLASPVKREPSRSGEFYPHIYGPLDTSAVVRVRRISPDTEGKFSSVQGPD
jgi:uncharacterized protein (DUF952 family)